MFDFFDEIANRTGLPFDILNKGFRVVNFGNKSVFIEGFVSITNFEEEEISIKLKKGIVKITGKNLAIKNMNIDSIVISGNIFSCEVC
ncbi:MAG: YabP/YqfC family sporulation protein [Clostridia bacterium]|nr:YabP/YqfC family sporulation protein [Clostridia bacterium]